MKTPFLVILRRLAEESILLIRSFTMFRMTFLLALLTFNFYLLILPVYAVDSSPSADIKSKLEELKREIASKAAVLKQEVNKQLTNKAYIGKIKTKSSSAITLASKNGPRIVNINQDTEFESQLKAKKYSQKLISEEDFIVSLGDVDENQVLTAKKFILLNPMSQTLIPKTYLWGQIVSVSEKLVFGSIFWPLPLNQTQCPDLYLQFWDHF